MYRIEIELQNKNDVQTALQNIAYNIQHEYTQGETVFGRVRWKMVEE